MDIVAIALSLVLIGLLLGAALLLTVVMFLNFRLKQQNKSLIELSKELNND